MDSSIGRPVEGLPQSWPAAIWVLRFRRLNNGDGVFCRKRLFFWNFRYMIIYMRIFGGSTNKMAVKNTTQVLIDGKIITLSGYESPEYLQKVASYINQKIGELSQLQGYNRLSVDTKHTLISLNVADDYFKAREQAEMLEEDMEAKDAESYELRSELAETKVRLESMKEELEQLRKEKEELSEQLSKTNEELEELLK